MDLRGTYPALISPFNPDLSFNYDVLRRLVRELKSEKVDGFYVCGSTAETFSLSVEEREKALEAVMEEAGDCPVIAHVGTLNPMDLRRLASHAARCGVAAVSSVPPFYFKHSQAEIDAYYQDIMDASGLKVILYNIPAFTGVSLNKRNTADLFATGKVAGIKHTSHNLYDLERLKAAYPEAVVLSGYDEVFCAARALGADGCIGSSLNLMAAEFVEIHRLSGNGVTPEAMKVQRKVNDVIDAMQQFNFFAALKYLLELKGLPVGTVRRPLLSLTELERRQVEDIFRNHFR